VTDNVVTWVSRQDKKTTNVLMNFFQKLFQDLLIRVIFHDENTSIKDAPKRSRSFLCVLKFYPDTITTTLP